MDPPWLTRVEWPLHMVSADAIDYEKEAVSAL